MLIPNGDVRLEKDDIISVVITRKDSRQIFERLHVKTNKVKNCMIIGGGRTAYYLASYLCAAGISVEIIEEDTARCEQLSILLPKATIINGDGTEEEILKEEGIESVESFVPLTGIDEENILLTLYAKQVSNAKVVTKINRLNFQGVVSKLDLGSTIYPKYIISEAIIALGTVYVIGKSLDIELQFHF